MSTPATQNAFSQDLGAIGNLVGNVAQADVEVQDPGLYLLSTSSSPMLSNFMTYMVVITILLIGLAILLQSKRKASSMIVGGLMVLFPALYLGSKIFGYKLTQ